MSGATGAVEPKRRQRVVPYVTYRVLRDVLMTARAPLPERFVAAEWGLTGQAVYRVPNALRFFGLLEGTRTTTAFHSFVRTAGAQRLERMRQLIRTNYPWIWQLGPGSTKGQFMTALEANGNVRDGPANLAAAFISAAARDLSLDLPCPLPGSGRPSSSAAAAKAADSPSSSTESEKRRDRLFNHLMSVAKRQEGEGVTDPDILDRLERVVRLDAGLG